MDNCKGTGLVENGVVVKTKTPVVVLTVEEYNSLLESANQLRKVRDLLPLVQELDGRLAAARELIKEF